MRFSKQADGVGSGHRVVARADAELAIDRADMGPDRVGREVELFPHLPCRQVRGQEAEDGQLRLAGALEYLAAARPSRCQLRLLVIFPTRARAASAWARAEVR